MDRWMNDVRHSLERRNLDREDFRKWAVPPPAVSKDNNVVVLTS